jgi:predicted nuclease of predicted toxin-antitoxin system
LRVLIDACLPRDFGAVIASYGHEVVDARDIGMRRADDPVLAAYAKSNGFALLSEDWGFANIRTYPPQQYYSIVVFETGGDSIDEKAAALRNLLDRADVVQALPGRLAIVTATRIRLRPPL